MGTQGNAEPGDVVLEEISHQADFQLSIVADGLIFPWGMAFLPDRTLIVTESVGQLRLVRNARTTAPIVGVPPVLSQEGRATQGLMSVAVHKKFDDNKLIYLCYLHGRFDANVTRVARARLDEKNLELHDVAVIYEANNNSQDTYHSGCRLVWADDGHLFVTLGDRRHHMNEAQNLDNAIGTIIRINDDGSIPNDNPFIKQEGARPETWAYGVRNVQGAVMHPETHKIWFSEHGPLGGDEINILERGANYGWPIATYGIDYDGTIITEHAELPGVHGPLTYWRPSTAPSGLAFYVGKRFPNWEGDLFVGSLMDHRLIRMEIRDDRILFQEPLLAELNERIRDVRLGPDGYLYILTDANPGAVLRLEPN